MQYAITGAFIAVDIISGVLKAFTTKSWNSSIMRQGLFHKMGFILIIVLALLCDYGQVYLDLGFAIPITKPVLIYIIVTEIGSIIENVSFINPELVPDKLKAFFIKANKED